MESLRFDLSNYNDDIKKDIISKIPFISVEINDSYIDGCMLTVTVKKDPSYISEKVKELLDKLHEDSNKYVSETIFENDVEMNGNFKDAYSNLLKRGWIINYDNGLVGLGGEFLKLYYHFDKLFLEWASNNNAEEYIYPELISIDDLIKCNYISQFPHHLLFANHLKEDYDTIKEFSHNISSDEQCFDSSYFSTPKHVNKSSICIHTYKQYENMIIDLDHPIVVTSMGKCKRYESFNMKSLERLLDFRMREISFIGSEELVLRKREIFMELTKSLILQLELKANIKTSSDPFFLNEFNQKALLQKKFKLKYETNFYLPDEKRDLAVGSYNYHATYFSDAFNIKGKNDKPVYTGCVAFGLERFVYAFLSQKGFDTYNDIL